MQTAANNLVNDRYILSTSGGQMIQTEGVVVCLITLQFKGIQVIIFFYLNLS